MHKFIRPRLLSGCIGRTRFLYHARTRCIQGFPSLIGLQRQRGPQSAMRLKRLELIGFKSFAEKAVFDFEGSLTGLVGPNGSGKSNVVDALKWVLGEQSAQRLRGSEMADMIFNGSARRKPLAVGEVRVTLQNAAGLLPVDYEEVCITRRCYRTGESEYFINEQPCRLKDIRMLLMDTGVGVSAYSFIEQGQVDMLLRASSKERRKVFEEAAGINRYLQQKKEAERKLERVQVNLQRVADIIEELQRQLRSVRYQAAKARRFKRYSDELQQLRISLALHNTRELAAERGRLADSITEQEQVRCALDERLGALRGELNSGQQQLDALRRRLSEMEDRLNQIGARDYALGKEIELNENRLAELRARRTELQERSEELRFGLDRVKVEAQDADSRLSTGREKLQQQRGTLEGKTSDLQSVEARCNELKAHIESARTEVFGLLQQESQLQNQIGMLTAERQTLGNRLRRQRELLAQLHQQCAQSRAERAAEQQRLDEAASRLGAIRQRLASVDEDLSGANGNMDRLTSVIGELRGELKAKLSRQQVLQDLQARAEGVGTGVRVILEDIEREDSPLAGSPGLLANLLNVPARDAFAVEAALGHTAEAVVAGTREQAREALRLLTDGQKGRAEVIPAEGLVLPEQTEAPVPWAARLVDLLTYDARVDSVVKVLLGNCFVVDSVSAALALLARGMAPGTKVVTRTGECFAAGGIWSAGTSEAGGLISRRSQLLELDGEIADVREQIGALTHEGRAYAERIEQLQGVGSALRAREGELAADHNEVQNRVSLLASQEQQRGEDLGLARDEAESMGEEIDQIGTRVETFQDELQEVGARRAGRQSQIEAAERDLVAQKQTRGSLTSEVHALRGEIGRLEEQMNGLQTLTERLHGEIAQREAELQRIAEEQRSSAGMEQEAQQTIQQAQQGRNGLAEEKTRLESETQQMGASCREAEARINSLREQTEQQQARREEVEQALNEVKMKENELRLRLETMRERAAEECGVNLDALELDPEQWREQPLFADTEIEEFREAASPSDQVASWYVQAEQQEPEEEAASKAQVVKLEEAVALRDRSLDVANSAETNWDEVKARVEKLRKEVERMGGANLDSIREQDELEQRADYLIKQKDDLEQARRHEMEIIRELSQKSRENFLHTFETVRENFQTLIRKLFGGGTGDLVLEAEAEDVLEAGIDILVRPPGKEPRSISLLSGGEKALAAVALLFAIFEAKPSPFCLLDEVDAPLDEANVGRFLSIVEDYRKDTQFIIVTHNKVTMSAAETLYGVSLQEDGVSKKVVVNFEEVDTRLAEMTRETRLAERRAKAG